MKLRIGSKFENNFGIEFTILNINEDKDWCKVKCANLDGMEWTEEWDDLHFVYSALEIGEYSMISNGPMQDETPIELVIQAMPSYYEPFFERKDIPYFKQKGFMKHRR